MKAKKRRPRRIADLTGQRFGRLLVVGLGGRYPATGQQMFRCKCDCGGTKDAIGSLLVNGNIRSCGCLRRESAVNAGAKVNLKHGWYGTKEYSAWSSMKQRCLNPNNSRYKDYGGRGIQICKRWRSSFQNFLADMGRAPKGTSIDRINNDGNYEPGNCRWTMAHDQLLNRRTSVVIEHGGERKTLYEWAEALGMPYGVFYSRVRKWKDVARAIEAPYTPKRMKTVANA